MVSVAILVAVSLMAGVARIRYSSPLGHADISLALSRFQDSGAPRPCCAISSWPAAKQSAVSIPELGYEQASGPELPVPIASTTKIMTAYVILQDHPLAMGSNGPEIAVTPQDVSTLHQDEERDESNVPVRQGEVLSELQMLQGVLIRSANNLATALAVWDTGTLSSFVGKMNHEAAALGMSETHFAGVSGYDPASVSTASDLLVLAARAMSDPVFAQIVDEPRLNFPGAGILSSYTPLVGTHGVIGVKSGFTGQAGPCDVLALRESVAGRPFMIFSAVLGSTKDDTDQAGYQALALARGLVPDIALKAIAIQGQLAGHAVFWGDRVPIVIDRTVQVLVLGDQGAVTTVAISPGRLGPGDHARTVCGVVRFVVGKQTIIDPLLAPEAFPRPTTWQRIIR